MASCFVWGDCVWLGVQGDFGIIVVIIISIIIAVAIVIIIGAAIVVIIVGVIGSVVVGNCTGCLVPWDILGNGI